MNSLLYLALLSCLALLVASEVPDIPSYPRKQPRRPPPPARLKKPILDATNLDHRQTQTEKKEEALKIQENQARVTQTFDIRLPIRNPWPRRVGVLLTAPRPAPTTTFAPVVLYKRDCDPCMPGWGVKSMCNSTSNTVCRPCPMGTWSPHAPHYRPCVPCSKCASGMFEQVTCVSTRDTKCDSCSNPKAKINDDFIRKCNWRQLTKNVDPTELDLDDTRFNVEVLDLQSKELSQFDESPEFEEDADSVLLPPMPPAVEEDISVDDPEIDLEQPASTTPADEDASSKEEEKKWAKIISMRGEASAEIDLISKRLESDRNGRLDETLLDDDEDDDVEQGPRRHLLHPIRPFPQMVPVPRLPTLGDREDDMVFPSEPPVENNFPPSYHSYPIDSLLHAGEGQRRKAIVLLVLTCAIVLSTIIFLVCYVREYCRRRGNTSYNRVLVVNLSPEEREIVRQSASVLEQMDHTPKKYRTGNAYTHLIDPDVEAPLSVTENPLEAYLNTTDDRSVAREPLIENEVLQEPKVHRHAHA